MRKLFVLLALVAVTSIVCLSTTRADESKDNKTTQAAKDPNYRYYNGQWWYWMPQQKNWKVWNGNAWIDYQPGVTRSFSYTDGNVAEGNSATARMFGTPIVGGFPNSVRNRQIIGSYGFRSAGSKINGNY